MQGLVRQHIQPTHLIKGLVLQYLGADFWKEKIATNMTPEDRNQMIELCKRIARETDFHKLASLIDELNELIRSKIRELRDSRRTC